MVAPAVVLVIFAYLVGSFPSGYVYSRLIKGVDIRDVGDRYMGAKNVFLNVGPAAGVATAITDFGKGALAVALVRAIALPEPTVIFIGLAVVAGHIWPIYLKFRDGAGAMTAGGVLVMMLPIEFLILAPFSIIALAVSRKTTIASTVFLALPLLAWAFGEQFWLIVLPLPLAALVALRVYRRQVVAILGMGRGKR